MPTKTVFTSLIVILYFFNVLGHFILIRSPFHCTISGEAGLLVGSVGGRERRCYWRREGEVFEINIKHKLCILYSLVWVYWNSRDLYLKCAALVLDPGLKRMLRVWYLASLRHITFTWNNAFVQFFSVLSR